MNKHVSYKKRHQNLRPPMGNARGTADEFIKHHPWRIEFEIYFCVTLTINRQGLSHFLAWDVFSHCYIFCPNKKMQYLFYVSPPASCHLFYQSGFQVSLFQNLGKIRGRKGRSCKRNSLVSRGIRKRNNDKRNHINVGGISVCNIYNLIFWNIWRSDWYLFFEFRVLFRFSS